MKKLGKINSLFADLLWGKSAVEDDLIILKSDGGICSQIAFWACGRELEAMGHKLKYDLSWFEECGKDMDGKHVRNFDMCKAFPELEINVADEREIFRYKRKYRTKEMDITIIRAPAYLGEYYDRWPLVLKHADILRKYFLPDNLEFDNNNSEILADIKASKSPCAVHVRRGDLGVYNKFYGDPLDASYFLNAMQRVLSQYTETRFYLFSDEPEWLRVNLIPKFSAEIDYRLVEANAADKGYVDLFLMSNCQNFIASHGSLAKYARVLSETEGLIVEPSSKADFSTSNDKNVIII